MLADWWAGFKDLARIFYFQHRDGVNFIVAFVTLLLIIGLILACIFIPGVGDAVAWIVTAALVIFLALCAFAIIWVMYDTLLPTDPRKEKDEKEEE